MSNADIVMCTFIATESKRIDHVVLRDNKRFDQYLVLPTALSDTKYHDKRKESESQSVQYEPQFTVIKDQTRLLISGFIRNVDFRTIFRFSDDVMNIILRFLHYKHPTPLLTAVYHGYTGLITELWPEHKNDVTEEGLPALHYAAKLGQEQSIRALIEGGADVNDDAGIGETPLITACTHHQSHIVKVLLEYPDIEVNRPKGKSGWFASGSSPLFIAVERGSLECVRALLTSDTLDLNMGNGWSSPMQLAASNGHLVILEILYQHLLSTKEPEEVIHFVNAGHGYSQWTMLHAACHSGHEDVVQYLLDTVKVKISPKSSNGATPFMEAARQGHVNVLKILYLNMLRRRGIIDQSDEKDVMEVVTKGQINETDATGATALHMACTEGHLNVVEYLVDELYVNMFAQDNDGHTALDVAMTKEHSSVISWLSQRLLSGKEQRRLSQRLLSGKEQQRLFAASSTKI